jgi:prepilin-type N-terminal cleavage/methylation domain-containing protein
MQHNIRNSAFTLAEVLITLGIIGVVAALTMPSMIAKYEKKATVTKLKLIYSILSQATELSKNEYGYINTWDGYTLNARQFAEQYYIPHLKVAKTCTTMAGGCWKDGYYYDLAGSKMTGVPYSVVLANGMVLGFYKLNNSTYAIHVLVADVNGQKGPNKMGRDIFAFYPCIDQRNPGSNCGPMNDNHSLFIGGYSSGGVPAEGGWRSRSEYFTMQGACSKSAYTYDQIGSGTACGALIKADDWEIKDDYPW